MTGNSIEQLKAHLRENVGDIGIEILQNAISKLDIDDEPSRDEIEDLISIVEKKLAKLVGDGKTQEILDNYRNELIEEAKSLEYDIIEILNTHFSTEGIPTETDIHNLSKLLKSKGYHEDENEMIDTLRRHVRNKIQLALNDAVINEEIRSFYDKYPDHTNADVEDFIQYLKINNNSFDVDIEELREKIERERLFRKFKNFNHEESLDEKIVNHYFILMNSGKDQKINEKGKYEYIMDIIPLNPY